MSDLVQLAQLIKSHRECAPLASLPYGDAKVNAVVAGAYKGETMAFLLELFPGMTVHGFEPQGWACQEAMKLLKPYGDRAVLHNYGLGVENIIMGMEHYGTDRCAFTPVRADIKCELRDATEVLPAIVPKLCVFNMEGYEYPLVAYLTGVPYLLGHHLLLQEHSLYPEQNQQLHANLLYCGLVQTWRSGNWSLWERRS